MSTSFSRTSRGFISNEVVNSLEIPLPSDPIQADMLSTWDFIKLLGWRSQFIQIATLLKGHKPIPGAMNNEQWNGELWDKAG